jgi:hypothetical protein
MGIFVNVTRGSKSNVLESEKGTWNDKTKMKPRIFVKIVT